MAGKRKEPSRLKLEFADVQPDEETPRVAVVLLDREGKTIQRALASAAGDVSIAATAYAKANKVLIVAAEGGEEAEQAMVLRAGEVTDLLEQDAVLRIPRDKWGSLVGLIQCVEGSVSHCTLFPYVIDNLLLQTTFDKIVSPSAIRPPFRPRCEIVCDGEVSVYRRRCCCRPWVIDDPRVGDLIDRLREILYERPPIKWPPPPPPPDGWQIFPARPGAEAPELRAEKAKLESPQLAAQVQELEPEGQPHFLRSGTISEAALFAEQDIANLESLTGQALADYVIGRDYLRPYWCTCGPPQLVATGRIRPDGTFFICWRGPIYLLPIRNCHDEYAFVVRQSVNGGTVTIYNGLASNQWFDDTSGIELVSYDPRAIGCRGNPFPDPGAFVILQDIGMTQSWRLKTPDQDTWDGVLPPAFNDGLLDPAASLAAAKGNYRNSNWGGALYLRYHFSEPLRGVGGRYYRISVIRADGAGNPTGPRSYLGSPLSWLYFEIVGTDIFVQSESLGPLTVGGESNLYRIPYDADHDWQDGQYHGIVDTTAFANDRHLIMIEVFDAAGNKIRPTGSSGPGTDKPFTFRRWYQQIGPTANVPFAALTHMFWWDNRPSVATITGLRLNGVVSGAQCQFLKGKPGSLFSADYRAYHQDEMFILQHNLWWRRGLGGPTGDLSPAAPSPRYDNVGKPPANPGTTPKATFLTMLDTETRCSFALNLHVDVKTTNGFGVLTGFDADDQAAFALET